MILRPRRDVCYVVDTAHKLPLESPSVARGAVTNSEPERGHNQPHVPPPTLWPIGFAIGVACILVGLVVSWPAVAIGAAIALVFGGLWVHDLSRGVRTAAPPALPAGPPESTDAPPVPAQEGPAGAPPPKPGEAFPRSRFLEGATLGLGAVIGGVVTVPPLGFALIPPFLHQGFKEIDVGPITNFPEGKFVITTFVSRPEDGDVSRRTAYIRNNGIATVNGQQLPSFTIISNRCAHLGCPVQPNGPVDQKPITVKKDAAGAEILKETGVQAAGFGCPCHGGAYDTEGNRTAGPPVRSLDRYKYSIKNGHLILGDEYSVQHVVGTGKDARIKRVRLQDPGQHVGDDWEAWLWPIPSIHGA